MSYLVLARKYRPADFSAVSGQEHVTRTLGNAIKRDKVPHAVLLAGPRGVGKTSIARIFSKALNCVEGPTPSPCLKCVNCREISQGTSLAVREIDGASNNSVDNVRELIDSFRTLPAPGYRYKVYIIDEVHMLSIAAFNALLKSLEEPPPNTVFILATTEAHRIPETVISRCQRHDLKALTAQEIEEQLLKIVKSEKIGAEREAIGMIAKLAGGSMRDAQSLLDRVHSFCEGKISAAETGRILGMVERKILFALSEAVLQRDAARALETIEAAFSQGLDISVFLREFVSHWRELLLARFSPDKALASLGIGQDQIVDLRRQAEALSQSDIQDLFTIAREGADLALRSSQPLYALEALLVRMCTREKTIAVADIAAALKNQKHGMVSPQAAAPSVQEPRIVRSPGASSPSPAPQPAARPVSRAAEGTVSLDWRDFVRKIAENGSKVLSEHVKRLAVKTFAAGVLEAIGPDFTISSLEKDPYREKLREALSEYSKVAKWSITLEKIEEGAASAAIKSVADSEKSERMKTISDKKKNLSDHPQVKRLQQAFPGSAIEDIKIKE